MNQKIKVGDIVIYSISFPPELREGRVVNKEGGLFCVKDLDSGIVSYRWKKEGLMKKLFYKHKKHYEGEY